MKEKVEIIVGSIVDWPNGKTYADIVGLPKAAHDLACYVATGDEAPVFVTAPERALLAARKPPERPTNKKTALANGDE